MLKCIEVFLPECLIERKQQEIGQLSGFFGSSWAYNSQTTTTKHLPNKNKQHNNIKEWNKKRNMFIICFFFLCVDLVHLFSIKKIVLPLRCDHKKNI